MTETTEISEIILESLRKNDDLRRKHASFWNFHKKTSKELGLFSELFRRFQRDFGGTILEWGLCDDDPPDIFARLSDGSLKGVEITELVNEKAIHAQIKKTEDYGHELFRFDYEESVKKLRQILAEKEKKLTAKSSSYNGLSLLIHTDEFLLQSDQFAGKEGKIFPGGSELFEGVYLVFSYEPQKQKCPVLRLI